MRKILYVIIFLLVSGNVYSDTGTEFNWFWVFYEHESKPGFQCNTFRPFYLKNTKTNNNTYTASLIPVVFWQYQNDRKTEWKSLFGLIESVDYVHGNGVRDYDFGVFPFLLYGNSPDARDKYLHVWPFGGTVKQKLGQDKISTVLFPGFLLFFVYPPVFPPTWINLAVFVASMIPLYVDYESRDYKAFGIFWPIIQRGKSPTRDDKRILPFYAHNYKKDIYDNYSVLMIFNYGRTIMKGDEERTFFAFPFYGRRWNLSSIRGSSSLFWPFFSWGYDIKRDDFELNFPWPLVQWQTSRDPNIIKRIFFPLWGMYKRTGKDSSDETFFLTPLHFSLKKHTATFNSEYYIDALIIWYFKRDYNGKPNPEYGNSWRYFKIWPLFQYEHDDRGNLSFNLLSLLPFRDPEGYEKLYQPFWTLFEYRRFESGEKRFGLFLRLYYQRWGVDFLNIKVPVLLSYGSSGSTSTKLTFFDYFTLFCYNNDRNGKYFGMMFSMFAYASEGDSSYMRFFWIPIQLSESTVKKEEAGNETGLRKTDEDIDFYYEYESVRFRNFYDIPGSKDTDNIVLCTLNIF
jgi:hypothetical protein